LPSFPFPSAPMEFPLWHFSVFRPQKAFLGILACGFYPLLAFPPPILLSCLIASFYAVLLF
jgi:hypothetical protein